MRRIARPWRDWDSWTFLLGVLALWGFARLLVPGPDGAHLPGLWLPSCPLRAMTGVPCPFCGITNGSAWLAQGNLGAAWRSNILSPLLMLGSATLAAYVVVFRVIAGRALALQPGRTIRRALWITAAALVAASWAVNFIRY